MECQELLGWLLFGDQRFKNHTNKTAPAFAWLCLWVVGKEPTVMGSVGGGHLGLTSGQLSLIREGCARALRHALLHTLLELLDAVWKVSGRVLTRQDSTGG